MKPNRYHCVVNRPGESYVFYSTGPKGKIRKLIDYELVEGDVEGIPRFNLSFSDWDYDTQTASDMAVSNNGDRDKVLATIAYTIVDFTRKEKDRVIIIEGSTPPRTRLYQMAINAHYDEVSSLFFIQGRIADEWETFNTDKNYEAFSIIRK